LLYSEHGSSPRGGERIGPVQHVYYSIDEAGEVVVIRTIWGARRGRGPKL
jgi:hypothetical protein